MSLQLPLTFESPSSPGNEIHYVCLNPSAPNNLLFCYGAGGTSTFLTLFQDFIKSHPKLSIICIDRWVQTSNPTPGSSLLPTQTLLTMELLNHLCIPQIHIAAHSAGAYQALDLISRHSERILGPVFPICTHIPAPFTDSKLMSWMCTMPSFLFTVLGKIDQLEGTKAEKMFLRLVGSPKIELVDDGTFVHSKELRDVLRSQTLGEKEVVMRRERLDADYRLGYARFEGVGVEDLVGLYRNCKVNLVWFTCQADVFFGPASVERMGEEMRSCKKEVVVVEGACHSDILFRSEVWERMYTQITTGSDE